MPGSRVCQSYEIRFHKFQQFHKEFTPVTDTPIPDKGPNPFHQMKDINIQVSGVEKLNPHKAKGPDEIHGRVLRECKK